MLGQSISRNSLLLGLFALATTAVVAGTFLGTQSTIKDNIRKAEEKALLDIIPKERHNNSMLDDAQDVDDQTLLGLRETKKLYIAKQNGSAVAVIVPATARDGYTGDIDVIVGINIDGSVAGVRVLSHRETPGLGDNVEVKKSDWVFSFNGKSLANPATSGWQVKKDGGVFDQFTGATITPRAVVTAVHRALQYFEQHREKILDVSNNAQAGTQKTGENNHG
jgi:electron transport complex protein RnfG